MSFMDSLSSVRGEGDDVSDGICIYTDGTGYFRVMPAGHDYGTSADIVCCRKISIEIVSAIIITIE